MHKLRPVPDHPGTFAADDGTVWTSRDGDLVPAKQHPHSKGYLTVNVRHAATGRVRPALVHRLVCAAFHGPPPPGTQTRHLDGDKRNNTPSNLTWGSALDNSADRARHGRVPAGERHHAATLTAQDVYAARHMAAMGVPLRAIARHFGAGETALGHAVSGRTWKSVPGPIRQRKEKE